LNNIYVELLSLSEIEEMERQQNLDMESLQISVSESGSGQSVVKCQQCAQDIPIPPSDNPKKRCKDRLIVLRRRIEYIENYRWGNYGNGNAAKQEDLRAIRQEIAYLEEQEAKADKMRKLPLYGVRLGKKKYLYICSNCFDKLF
jgi:hypothetical protein